MKNSINIKYGLIPAVSLIITLSASGCQKQMPVTFRNEIDSVSSVWVPDHRNGIFNADLVPFGHSFILKGETDIPEAKNGLINLLKKKGVGFADSMKVLPDTIIIKKPWGLVNVSVCNIRKHNSFDAEMVSQALMGTPVRILKSIEGWYLIQTPDRYIGWVDGEAVAALKTTQINSWKRSDRLFYTRKTGDVLADTPERKVISDIVAGCIIQISGEKNGFYTVTLPDGRKGLIGKNEAIRLGKLTAGDFLTRENLLTTAESFMGIPYLWGGTSAKGFDCSGFVKTIYFLNGIILSRDASQQFENGIVLKRSFSPDSLEKGDLLFFGSYRSGRPRPAHVAMYIGDSEFIHASGMVKINSFDSTRVNFSRFRRDSFLGARRIIGVGYGKGIEPVLSNNWYR